MVKAILKWLLSSLFLISAGYYGVSKLLGQTNSFISLIDSIIGVIGIVFNFIAEHILAILIVLGLAGLLWCIYYYIVSHHNKNF